MKNWITRTEKKINKETPTLKKTEDLKKTQTSGGTNTLNLKTKEHNNFQKHKTTFPKPTWLMKNSPTNLKYRLNSCKMKSLNSSSKLSEKIMNLMKISTSITPSKPTLKMTSEGPDQKAKNQPDNYNSMTRKNTISLKIINKKTLTLNKTLSIKSESQKQKETHSIRNSEEPKNL